MNIFNLNEKIEESERRLQHLKLIQRDYVCQCCGYSKEMEKLEEHTVIDDILVDDDNDNKVILCKWCHEKYHEVYPGKANIHNFLVFLRRFGSR